MNRTLHIINRLCLLVVAVFAMGCQEELLVIEEPTAAESLSRSDSTVTTVLRMLQKDGSSDNILDRASCTTVRLPVNVVVNEQELLIKNFSDFETIEQIFDQSEEDEDTLRFVFPIVLVLPDYTATQVSNNLDFLEIISACSNDQDEDIECIDFGYPIDLSTYNITTQIADVLTFQEDEALFHFLQTLDEERITSFQYPMNLIQNGMITEISDNNALITIITEADGTCDENDSVETKEEEETSDFLISGIWEIILFSDSEDNTNEFDEFLFLFNSEGIVTAEINEIEVGGNWKIDANEDDDSLALNLEFDTEEEPLIWLNEEWVIISRSSMQIEMKTEGEDDFEKLLSIRKR